MADQAEAYYAFLDSNGVVLNLGRTRRIATRGQSAALYARDSGCSSPAAEPRRNGPNASTSSPGSRRTHRPEQLTLVCAYHHHNFHTRSWTGCSTPTASSSGDHQNPSTPTRNP